MPSSPGSDVSTGYTDLCRHSGVPRQIVAASLSRMTQPLLTLPLLVGVQERYHNHALAAVAVGLYTAGFAAMMPMTGRLVDRHGGRAILRIWLMLALIAVLGTSAALTMAVPTPVLLSVVTILGMCLPPVGVVTRAGWPLLIPRAQLGTAYALDTVINEAATITGPLLAALTLSILPAPLALLTAFLPITVGSLGLPAAVLDRARQATRRPARGPQSRRVILTYGITFCASLGAGSLVATAGRLATEAEEPGIAGVLLAAAAIGAVAAGTIAGRHHLPADALTSRLIGFSAAITAAFIALTIGLPARGQSRGGVANIVTLAVLYLVLGSLTGPRDALLQLSIVLAARPAQRSTSFSWLGTCGLLGFGFGSAVSGLVGNTLGQHLLPAAIAAGVALALSGSMPRPNASKPQPPASDTKSPRRRRRTR